VFPTPAHGFALEPSEAAELSRSPAPRDRGYGARGELPKGLTFRRDRSTFRGIGREPQMDESFSWFDPTNNDDRFIACVVELTRQHPRSGPDGYQREGSVGLVAAGLR
jgi:hypothetical protein